VVVVARPSAAQLDFDTVRAELHGAEHSLRKVAERFGTTVSA
jgi:hypothetical protein